MISPEDQERVRESQDTFRRRSDKLNRVARILLSFWEKESASRMENLLDRTLAKFEHSNCAVCGHDRDEHELTSGSGKPYDPDVSEPCDICECYDFKSGAMGT